MRTILLFSLIFFAAISKAQSFEYYIPIANSSDDAEQEGSFVDVNDLELDLGASNGEESLIGLFFRSISLDVESSVDSAIILLTLQQDFDSSLTVNILLENETNPESYVDSAELKENRSFYSESIAWTIQAGLKGEQIASPNLSSLLNQILSKNDWSPTSGVNFIIEPADLATDSFSNEIQIYSYDQSQSSRRPQLMLVTDSANINGVEAETQAYPIAIYPNPLSDLITVSGINTPFELNVFDVKGTLLLHQTATSKKIDLSELENGVYFMSLKKNKVSKTLKLIKAPH
jgi:hypothetical protein